MKRFIFIHIPKTGGTYVQEVLNTLNDNIVDVGHQWYNDIDCKGWDSWSPQTINLLDTKTTLTGYSKILKANDYVYTIIRNPFDLLSSYYHHGDNKYHNGWANCNNIHDIKSFEHFINLYCDENAEWHFPVLKDNLFSQLYKEDDLIIDEYIKFENLNNNIIDFSNKHNLILNTNLNTKLNQSNRRGIDYKNHYNNKMVDMLNIKLKNILKEFDYSFE